MIQNTLPVGSTLKGAVVYTIAEHLHNGGFGITYRATAQIMVGNIPQTATFTIKEFFMGKICSRDVDGNVVVAAENQQAFLSAKADFKSEAEILHSLMHDNIVPVNEVFEQNNTVYYVMSYLGNVSLYQYVAENGGLLSEAKAKQIIMPLTSALAYLHNRNILHLDIKPDNIMMVGQGDSIKPVLIDFGQAMYFVNGKPKRIRASEAIPRAILLWNRSRMSAPSLPRLTSIRLLPLCSICLVVRTLVTQRSKASTRFIGHCPNPCRRIWLKGLCVAYRERLLIVLRISRLSRTFCFMASRPLTVIRLLMLVVEALYRQMPFCQTTISRYPLPGLLSP